MGSKMVETDCNINQTFDLAIINKSIAQHWFQKFCNKNKGFEDEESHRYLRVIAESHMISQKIILWLFFPHIHPRSGCMELIENLGLSLPYEWWLLRWTLSDKLFKGDPTG